MLGRERRIHVKNLAEDTFDLWCGTAEGRRVERWLVRRMRKRRHRGQLPRFVDVESLDLTCNWALSIHQAISVSAPSLGSDLLLTVSNNSFALPALTSVVVKRQVLDPKLESKGATPDDESLSLCSLTKPLWTTVLTWGRGGGPGETVDRE